MFLLLPFLLLTTSTQRLVGLTLSLPELGGLLPPEPPGRVERVEIEARPEGLRVHAQVRRADALPGQTVVALMDAARADAQGELFPELSLATLPDAPPETP